MTGYLVSVYKLSFLFVIPAVCKPESSAFTASWTPDQARHYSVIPACRESFFLSRKIPDALCLQK
jgi:hypothetical protein